VRAVEPAPGDRLRLHIDPPPGVQVALYRDGLALPPLPPGTRSWIDPDVRASGAGVCYAVASVDPSTGHHSHRSRRRCWDGPRGARRRQLRPGPGGGFAVRIAEPGLYQFRVHYRNPGPFNTGITCAVKRIQIDGVAAGYLLMPHTGTEARATRASSWLTARVERPGTYRVRLVDDAHAVNMSAFRHFERYTGGAGGASGPRNGAEIVSLEVYSRRERVYLPAGGQRDSHVGARGEQ
jgi:hypothetical protein